MRLAIAVLITLCAGASAWGQGLSPMKGEITTFGEEAALRVQLRNPYDRAVRFEIDVLTEDWRRLEGARLVRRQVPLAPGATTSIMAVIPLEGERLRTFYLCATSQPFRRGGSGIRGQVCGKYRATLRSF
jgi:hypothetical protein